MRKQYLYALVALIVLICYYYGISLIQLPNDGEWAFVLLIFGGYFVLGFAFVFLFRRSILTNFALAFAIGFLGAMLSIVSYSVLLDPATLSQALQDLASLFIASFLIGMTVAVGTLVNGLLFWFLRWLARRITTKRKMQNLESKLDSSASTS